MVNLVAMIGAWSLLVGMAGSLDFAFSFVWHTPGYDELVGEAASFGLANSLLYSRLETRERWEA